jgi:tRNA (guanine-N(7)-)-methyltransferase subunit TRM82
MYHLNQSKGPANFKIRSPQLLTFTLEDDNTLKLQGTIPLSGNVLDVTGISSKGTVVVSVDTIREPSSTTTWKSSPVTPQTLVEFFQVNSSQGSLSWSPADDSMAAEINSAGTTELSASLEPKEKKTFDDSLYTLGNLRKMKFDD